LTHADTAAKSLKIEAVEVDDVEPIPDSVPNDKSHTPAQSVAVNDIIQTTKQKQTSKQVGGMTIGPIEDSDSDNELEKAFIALQLSKGATKSSGTQGQPGTESAEQETNKASQSETPKAKHDKESDKRNHYNPIQMFGFFVPTTLRQAQTSFVEVVVKRVPTLVELDNEMSVLEIEIRRTRKAIAKGN